MVRIAYLGLVLAGACGRIGFDGQSGDPDGGPPAPDLAACASRTNHDEDRDGIDDGCDLCPHVADAAQANADGDGVGDRCDVDTSAESILFFDPFTEVRPAWSYTGGASIVADQLVLTAVGGGAFASPVAAPGVERFEIAGEITATVSAARQLAVHAYRTADGASYYCELYDGGDEGKVGLTYTYDNVVYTSVMDLSIGRIDPGPLVMTVVHRRPDMQCIVDFNGQRVEVGGPVPTDLIPDRFSIDALDLDARLDYAIRITAN